MIPRPSSAAPTANASRYCGGATSTTTAVTTVMSRLTFVETETARWDGNGARAMPTTGAFLSGCTATERTIVGTDRTNCQKTVQPAKKKVNGSAITGDAFPSKAVFISLFRKNFDRHFEFSGAGCATSKTIAATIRMRMKRCALEGTEHVQNQSLLAKAEYASLPDGVAITTTTAATDRTRKIAPKTFAQRTSSNAPAAIASTWNADATVVEIATT